MVERSYGETRFVEDIDGGVRVEGANAAGPQSLSGFKNLQDAKDFLKMVSIFTMRLEGPPGR